jgi:hypothetical protein
MELMITMLSERMSTSRAPLSWTKPSFKTLMAFYRAILEACQTLPEVCVALVLTYRHPPLLYYTTRLQVLLDDPSPLVDLLLVVYNMVPGSSVMYVIDSYEAATILKLVWQYVTYFVAELREQSNSKDRVEELILIQTLTKPAESTLFVYEHSTSIRQLHLLRRHVKYELEFHLGFPVHQDSEHYTFITNWRE